MLSKVERVYLTLLFLKATQSSEAFSVGTILNGTRDPTGLTPGAPQLGVTRGCEGGEGRAQDQAP